MVVSNRNLLFQWSIFRFHVNFWGCSCCKKTDVDTVDASEIRRENHLGCFSKPGVNNGKNYQPQLVSRISEASTVSQVIQQQLVKDNSSIAPIHMEFNMTVEGTTVRKVYEKSTTGYHDLQVPATSGLWKYPPAPPKMNVKRDHLKGKCHLNEPSIFMSYSLVFRGGYIISTTPLMALVCSSHEESRF